jgi:geranylgeranyl reductase family protein
MKYEVVVVGAGPAGSTAAKFLSEKGVKVLLIDKSKFPRDKPCGGALSFWLFDRYPYANDKDLIESYSYGIYLHSSSLQHKLTTETDEPFTALVLRKKFDHGFLKKAVDSGAEFIGGKRVKDIRIINDNARVVLDDGTSIDSALLIGADGVSSIIAKKVGLAPPNRTVGICAFQEQKVSQDVLNRFFGEKRMLHAHLKFQGIKGYGWVFPKKEHLNIGIGEIVSLKDHAEKKKNIHDMYEQYLDYLKNAKIIPSDFGKGQLQGGIVPVYPLKKTYANRVLLCGDAAGFINPISGEGIYYAMASAEIAANVIRNALNNGDCSERFLSSYQAKWKKDFGESLAFLSRYTAYFRDRSETLIRLVNKDEKLAEMCTGILYPRTSMQNLKWKLFRRYLYVYVRELFRRNGG